MKPRGFELRKWYADVADPATGDLAICYHSALRWRGLTLRFFNVLELRGRQTLRAVASFRRRPALAFDDGDRGGDSGGGGGGGGGGGEGSGGGATLTLTGPDLHATWHGRAPAFSERLLDTPGGFIQWDCWLPTATARVQVPGAAPLAGLGYAECLTLTIRPWQLPIETLRWGRFLADGYAVVWIQWLGPVPRHLVFCNGVRHTTGSIGEDEVRFAGFRLALTDRVPLRAGPLQGTVFRRFPWLRVIFPARILRLVECKWRARGVLFDAAGAPIATGWCVHERVEWPAV